MPFKIDQPGPPLDHMMYMTRMHHAHLSGMADLKANVLLSVSAIMITFSAGYLGQPSFRWAAATLISFCFTTVLLAAYAVTPKYRKPGPAPDIQSPSFNLLFFGDFSRLTYEQFRDAMQQMMNDPSKVYEWQVREVYTLGLYLANQKYRFVRLAYLTFITGLVVSGAVLTVCKLMRV
jgi:hypothetical protein